MKRLLVATLLLTSIFVTSLVAEDAAPEVNLPKVLIIGDSISMAYTRYVKQVLHGKAVVTHHKGNAQYTGHGLRMLDQWIGDTNWDVIHFNWGIWDMYGWRYHKIDRSPPVYEQRLDELVIRLKKTGAKLIWGTTTPVCPAQERTMLIKWKKEFKVSPATEQLYLDAALRVMKKHHIQVNDLHALIAPERGKYALSDDDVHFTKAGCKMLGEKVAESIANNLKEGEQDAEPDF
jgi:hypothetical protein